MSDRPDPQTLASEDLRSLDDLAAEADAEEQAHADLLAELDALAQAMVGSGLATWASENHGAPERLIVRGAGNLLHSPEAQSDLERVRSLMDDLEQKRDIASFLELAQGAEGVRIFIGSENKLFSLSGSSLVVSPYMNADRTVVGAIGVIGPTRLNYGRIVPIVDYTAQLVGRLLSERT